MNNVIIFEEKEFGQIRTAVLDGEPMFCLADVCKALEITHVTDVKNRLKQGGVGTTEVIDSLGRKQKATFINESNLYKTIFQSRKESAERDRVIEQKQARIEKMKPKEIFADAVATSTTSILIGDLAKLIKQNGVDMGQKRLFLWLRENGYLIKRNGSDYNMPTQKSMEMNLFEVKESTVNNPDGSVRINRTTKVTGKGQQYFINKFLA